MNLHRSKTIIIPQHLVGRIDHMRLSSVLAEAELNLEHDPITDIVYAVPMRKPKGGRAGAHP